MRMTQLRRTRTFHVCLVHHSSWLTMFFLARKRTLGRILKGRLSLCCVVPSQVANGNVVASICIQWVPELSPCPCCGGAEYAILGNSEGILSPQVTCRALGIGAYLVRLGQRVIQVENSHIILTGASALNKVTGKRPRVLVTSPLFLDGEFLSV